MAGSVLKRFERIQYPLPPELGDTYRAYHADLFALRLNVGYICCMILVPGAFVFDMLVFPELWRQLLPWRILSGLVCIALIALFNRTAARNYPSLMGHVLNLAMVSIIVHLIHETGAYRSPYYAGLLLVFIGISMVFPWDFTNTFLASLLITILHYSYNFIPDLLSGPPIEWPAFWNSVYFLGFGLTLAIIGSTLLENARRRLFVATEEEKIRSRTLAESKERIDTLLKSRSRFISNITHELKTPLSIVIGNTELIARDSGCINEETGRQLRVIRRAAFQLSGHVDRIIAVSSTEDPEYKISTAPYNYVGTVQNAFSLFEGISVQKNISFTLSMPDSPLIAALDVVAIEEVLNNLLQNAFKFTPSGGSVTLTVGTDGMEIFTEVTDTGSGIPVGKIDNVFDRLYQADDDLSKRHEGIGIGLFLVKRNVENHGGHIGVRSEEGRGSVFRFTLPLHVDQTVPVRNTGYAGSERRNRPSRRRGVDRRTERRRTGREYQQVLGIDDLAQTAYVGNLAVLENRNPSRPSILLVEDNPGMMKVTADALFDDYNLYLAKDAFEALDKLHDHHKSISLILSDVMMPGMDGFAFCGRVMADERYAHIPIIFVTALMDEKEQLTGYRVGATDYIVKPYNMRILKEKIAHWIARRQYETLLKEMSASVEPQLEELTRYKDIVVHEINNPMQVISIADAALQGLSSLSYADAPRKDEEIQRFVAQIHEGVESIKSILDTSLEVQRGQLPVMEKESLADLLDEAMEQSQHLLGRIGKVTADTGPARAVRVACIPRMLVRAFVNIICNATEAIAHRDSGSGGAVSIGVDTSENGWVSVRIEDDGIGITPEERVNLFKFRYTTKQDGMGVGLHVVKTIIKLHEGSVGVESTPGSGSVFTVRLPVAVGERG